MAYISKGRKKSTAIDPAWRRHLEEAEAFTKEMGGVDQDVKKYFFDLSEVELGQTLSEYQRIHGQAAGEYAHQTFPAWRSGKCKMSGLVAKRLFALLPRRMPLRDKYSLVESLWRMKGPRSSKDFQIGADSTLDEIRQAVEQHFSSVVKAHEIPGEIVGRFSWLADGDVKLQQQLYNYYSSLEQPILMQGLAERLPLFLEQVKNSIGTSVAQNIRIGNHEVNLRFHSAATRVVAMAPAESSQRPVIQPSEESLIEKFGCFILIIVALVLFIFFLINE